MDTQTNFSDVVKNSFLSDFLANSLSFIDIAMSLLVAFVVGSFIYFIYKWTYRGVLYSPTYNATLLIMTMVTSIVIMTIGTNIVLSLGMVGALSIVRFRTAIKDPMDIVFMFWAIAVGISSGAGLYFLTIVGAIIVGMIILLLARQKFSDTMYLVVVHFTPEGHELVLQELSKLNYRLKSKIVRKGTIELTAEIRLKVDNTAFMTRLAENEHVKDVSLVQYNGDYAV